jgi:transcriptional regulator with XRE-family HTH domain
MRVRLRQFREQRGWTGQHLADVAGTSKGYVSDIEKGRRFPSGRLLMSFAKAFGVSVYALIEDDDPNSNLLAAHIEVMKDLSAADQRAVARHALGLLDKDAGSEDKPDVAVGH